MFGHGPILVHVIEKLVFPQLTCCGLSHLFLVFILHRPHIEIRWFRRGRGPVT